MPLGEDSLEYSYDNREAVTELRTLRRYGFRSPRDHLIVEFARVIIVVVPFFLFLLELIALQELVAFLVGYLALRWFEKRIKPWLLQRYGPPELRLLQTERTNVTLSSRGLKLENESKDLLLGWPVISVTRIGDAFLFRLHHEGSVILPDKWLPEGWTAERTREALQIWKRGKAE